MNVRGWLDLVNAVQVGRDTETPDGQGGSTTTTVLTTLDRAAMWQAGAGDRRVSGKIAQSSTDVLVIEPATYTFGPLDTTVVFGGETWNITGPPDNVSNRGVLTVVGLEIHR